MRPSLHALRVLVPIALVLFGARAEAQLSVSRSIVEMSDARRVQDVEVSNSGTARLYLDLTIAEIIDPESEEPRRVELDDPRTAPILVSPRQLMVPPGTRKRVRVILREDVGETDRVFRLRVKPYTGKLGLPDPGGNRKSSAIRVLLGYDLLLLARPAELRPDVRVTRDGGSIEFRNAGNTNVLLRRIVQCDPGVDPDGERAASGCSELTPNRLYAGETHRVALPRRGAAERGSVTVWQTVGLDNSSASY